MRGRKSLPVREKLTRKLKRLEIEMEEIRKQLSELPIEQPEPEKGV